MKTIRDRLTKKRKRLMLWMIPGYFCFVVGMPATNITPWFLILGLAGVAFVFVISLILIFGIRCPNCGGNLSYALTWPATWDFSVSKKIKFCPFCGVSLDKEFEN